MNTTVDSSETEHATAEESRRKCCVTLLPIALLVAGVCVIAVWLMLLRPVSPTDKPNMGSGQCTPNALIGTEESGHFLLYNSSENDGQDVEEVGRNNLRGDSTNELAKSSTSDVTLRIATYNIRAPFPDDRGSDCNNPFGWERRVDSLCEQINYYHPDIIGLQEDTYYQITQLKPYLNNNQYVGTNRDDCEELPIGKSPRNPFGVTRYDSINCTASRQPDALVYGGEFNSIWFRPSSMELLSWGVFWLGKATGRPGSHFYETTCSAENGGFGPSCDVGRIVTWARFQPKDWTYGIFYVFNTHISSHWKGSECPDALIRKIKDIAGTHLSYTLGDFNAAQFSDSYKLYRSYLNDPDNPHLHSDPAFSVKTLRQWPEEADNDYRRGGLVEPPRGTFASHVDTDSNVVYDFIWGHHIRILSNLNDRLRNTTGEAFRRLRSDHRMILATVELKPEYFFDKDDGRPVEYPPHLYETSSGSSRMERSPCKWSIFFAFIILWQVHGGRHVM